MASDKTIFITGFPGFIAARLVAKLAGPDVRQVLLAEPRFAGKARTEADAIADATGTPRGNFEIVEGDITKPGLGIDADTASELRGRIEEVFHLAAVYDLAVERGLAYRVNVDGTRNVNDFVRSLPRLSRYNYVSTCYVAGKREGRIFESDLRHEAGFRNFYEETKYIAEVSVDDLKSEVPVTVMRPSVVVGDSSTGETVKYDGIYYLIKYMMMAPDLFRLVNVGNMDVSLNLVPVDFVVDGMVAVSRNPEAVGKTVALADPEPLKTAELFDTIASVLTGKRSVITPPRKLVELFLKSPVSPLLTGLPHAGVPYFFVPQTYDTGAGASLLAEADIACPNFRSYAPNLIDFVKSHPAVG